jgi:hypothetical protein
MLIPVSLIGAVLLVLAYIVGSELCLPSTRIALRTGKLQLWKTACFLVALGEWAMLVIGLCLLLLVEHIWHLLNGTWPGRLAVLSAAGILVGMTIWELAWRTQRNIARVLSRSLDLVLPANGVQREIYLSQHRMIEYGSPAEQEQVLRRLFHEIRPTGKG